MRCHDSILRSHLLSKTDLDGQMSSWVASAIRRLLAMCFFLRL